MAEKKELSDLEKFTQTAKKGIAIFKDYEYVIKKVKETKEAFTKVTKIANAIEEINAIQSASINGILVVRQPLMGVYNGQIIVAATGTDLWAKAQTGLNLAMKANVMGIVITALGALVSVIGAFKMSTDDASTSTYTLTSEQEQMIQKSKEMQEAYRDMNNARLEAMSKVEAEYGYYEELEDELHSLVDANGKVKEGYEDRANFIVSQFSNALGIEKEQIWDMIRSNGELGSSLDEVMKKKKAEAMLMANEQAYTTAIREKDAAFSTYCESLKGLDEAEKKYNETKKIATEYERILKTEGEARAEEYRRTHMDEIIGMQETKTAYDKAKKAVEDNETAYVGYLATIQNYEGLSAAILSGDTEKIETAMQDLTVSFITAESGTKKTLTQQVTNMEKFYKDMNTALQKGVPGITEEMVEQAQVMVERSKGELEIAIKEALPEIKESLGNVGITASQAMIDTFTSQEEEVQIKILEFLGQINSGVALKQEELMMVLSSLGISTSDSLINALVGKEASVQAEAIQLISQLQNAEGTKRDEIITRLNELGIDAGEGYRKGINSKIPGVETEGANIVFASTSGTSAANPYAKGYVKGEDYGKGYANGIAGRSVSNAIIAAGKMIVERAIKSTADAQASRSPSKRARKLGVDYGEGYVLGIEDTEQNVKKASEDLAQSALQGMDVQKHLASMRSAMSMEKAMIGANLTSRIVHEVVMGNQSDFASVGEKIEALQGHIDNIKIQLQLEGKTYIDKREAGYILAPEINKRLGEFADLKGRGNNSR